MSQTQTPLQIHQTIIYRIPQFSYQATLKDCWPQLKEAIALSASEDFNKLIEQVEQQSDFNSLSPSLRSTLWKYFNRATYRATPYGAFAAVGIAGMVNNGSGIIVDDQLLHGWPDWSQRKHFDLSFANVQENDLTLFANDTWYRVGSTIRYVYKNETDYELAEIDGGKRTLQILKACCQPQHLSALPGKLSGIYAAQELLHAIETLYNDQLLFSSRHPNIIGEEYFERMPALPHTDAHPYIISERRCRSGALDANPLRHLPELIDKLNRMLPSYAATDLDRFRNALRVKFGEQEVPLMVALDPELGVGYGNMESDLLSTDVISKLNQQAARPISEDFHVTLKNLLPAFSFEKDQVIELDGLALPDVAGNDPLPNTIPVICTVCDGTVFYEYGGGATANSLLGRFTLANNRIYEHCKELAALENQSNPGVVFFDIGYQTGSRIDNVNRRKSIYDHQLSLLDKDQTDVKLSVRDLLVSVSGNSVILRSTMLDQRLIPRLASAYNYLFSDLPAFRFLCDLQHQGAHKNLSLRLRDRIQNLPFYPRVQYKNIIVSPAAWQLKSSDVSWFGVPSKAAAIRSYLSKKAPASYLKTGRGDQTLFFDTGKDEDMEMLSNILSKEKQLYVEESALPNQSQIYDAQGMPYLPQFVVTLYHRKQIYQPIFSPPLKAVDKVILPGEDWLYFQLFCHPVRSDEILCRYLLPLFGELSKEVKQYFFIRYNQDGYHLRIRIQLQEKRFFSDVVTRFMQCVQLLLDQGIVSDILIKPYRQETERYGSEFIREVEQHFCVDSQYVLKLIGMSLPDSTCQRLCLNLLDQVAESGIFNAEVFEQIIFSNSAAFCNEHRVSGEGFKQMNIAFKELQKDTYDLEQVILAAGFRPFIVSFLSTLKLYDAHRQPAMFNAFFHMHVNRLFPNRQRAHETFIYYCYERMLIRNKKVYATKISSS